VRAEYWGDETEWIVIGAIDGNEAIELAKKALRKEYKDETEMPSSKNIEWFVEEHIPIIK